MVSVPAAHDAAGWCPVIAAEWEDPAATHLVWLGKKAAGRTLDGRTWDEFPTLPTTLTTAQILAGA